MLKLITTLFLCLFPLQASAEQPQPTMVLSGVVLEQGTNKLSAKFITWLSKKADYPLAVKYADSYQSLSKTLREHPECLAWTCGAPFIEDHASDQQQLIAVPLFHGEPTYHSLVVTRTGRNEKTLNDFKGLIFAYSDSRSNSGFIAPSYALQQQNIDINIHFRYLMPTGLHEYSIEALLANLADVACIDEYVFMQYLKLHPDAKEKLLVLEKIGPFPFTPIVAGRLVSHDVITRLQQALLNMPNDPEGKEILQQLGLDGFVIKQPSFYKPIYDMLQALK